MSSFFMSSKDLEGVLAIPDFFEHQIDSIKIEGRMKGPLYAGTTAKSYRQALDLYLKGDSWKENSTRVKEELTKVVHRDYCEGSLLEGPGKDSVYDERIHNGAESSYQAVGTVIEVKKDRHVIINVKNAFNSDDTLEVVPFREKACNP